MSNPIRFSSRKFSPVVKSHVVPRKVTKTRRRMCWPGHLQTQSDILLNSDISTKTLYFIERVCQTLHFSREKIHHSKQWGFATKNCQTLYFSREKSITQNNEDLRPKIIQIIKNVKTLCFSSRKFSPNVKSHMAPRKVAKTRRRTLGLPITTKPNPTFY